MQCIKFFRWSKIFKMIKQDCLTFRVMWKNILVLMRQSTKSAETFPIWKWTNRQIGKDQLQNYRLYLWLSLFFGSNLIIYEKSFTVLLWGNIVGLDNWHLCRYLEKVLLQSVFDDEHFWKYSQDLHTIYFWVDVWLSIESLPNWLIDGFQAFISPKHDDISKQNVIK